MRITGARVFDVTMGFTSRDLCLDGRLISTDSTDGQTYDAADCYIIPGLTDLHFHGCKGHDFSDGDSDGLEAIAQYQLSRGVTQICPAVMTLSAESLVQICRTAVDYRAAKRPGAALYGINLEGPFLAPEQKGAHNENWLRAPDIALLHRLIEASDGLIKLVSVAPELPGALNFIEAVADEVTVSLSHTAADFEVASAAFRAGARQVTHLCNAMSPFYHREPGVVGAALDAPDCMVELICDGIHIHPAMVRAIFTMFAKRVILISDSMRAAGMPDGSYALGDQTVTVQGGRASLADGTLAGSTCDLMACLKNAVSMGIPLAAAVTAAAVNPARAIGIYSRLGSLEPGKLANIAVLDKNLDLKAVFFLGKLVQEY